MMYSIAYTYCPWTSTSRSIYTDDSYTVRLYETGVADQAVLILGIMASGQCSLASGTEAVPASTVLTNSGGVRGYARRHDGAGGGGADAKPDAGGGSLVAVGWRAIGPVREPG